MANLKISDTMLRVSKLFIQLLEKPMDFNEIFEYFNQISKTPVYSKEVIIKYLNTLRAAGLEIERLKGGKYYLYNFLTAITLNTKEIEAFKKLEIAVLRYGTIKNIRTFIDFKRKMIKFFDKETQKELNKLNIGNFSSILTAKVKTFQQLCEDNQKIKIKYKNKLFTVEPKQISITDNLIYLECYNTNQSEKTKFLLDKVSLIEQQPSKNTNRDSSTAVLYELSGKLAHTYKLKEGEKIIAEHPTKIFVKAQTNDYNFLARRLLRYQTCCKIIEPKEFRKYFISYTNKILDLYKDD